MSQVVVVAPTPFPGSGIDAKNATTEVNLLMADDLTRDGAPDALRALNEQVGAVNLDSASGNPYQPSFFYRGFEVSPLQGTPQGLAVYVNGVRFNQAFGDTVNWDLIPSMAIDRIALGGSNPTFGLNALGGALNVQLKNGFTSPGGEADLSGGSFGQVQADIEYGATVGASAVYLAASAQHQDGWRDLQSSDIQNFYTDLGWRGRGVELHLNLGLANSGLNGPGTSPVQLLAADPRAQFTAPNAIYNQSAALSLAGLYPIGADITLQGLVHYDYFRQRVVNGNAPNDTPCGDGSGLLCSDNGASTTLGGAVIPAFLGPSPFAYSELDNQTTRTNGYGVAVQISNTGAVFTHDNHLIAGLSFDDAQTRFDGSSYVGGIDPRSRLFVGPGVLIDELGSNTPVRLGVDNAYYGALATDTLDVTRNLSVTVSGRFNLARIDLKDKAGGDLSGNHAYSRFNPAIGASYHVRSWLTLYANYSEANRAPTPAELSCAGPTQSCSLANFFVGDPDLKQVVAHTLEAGLRGEVRPWAKITFTYGLGFYRTDLDDDIAFVNSVTLGRAFFSNIGRTRRQGLDADLQLRGARWRVYAAYSHTDATYRSGFVEAGGENPAANANGDLTVHPGNRLPGIAANRIKLGVSFNATNRLSLGATALGQDGAYLFGDEANVTPKLPGFFVVNLNLAYQLTPSLKAFVRIENATDVRYQSFGAFSPTSTVFLAPAPSASIARSYSPAAPVGGFGGLRVLF